jgi:hypothetical protein
VVRNPVEELVIAHRCHQAKQVLHVQRARLIKAHFPFLGLICCYWLVWVSQRAVEVVDIHTAIGDSKAASENGLIGLKANLPIFVGVSAIFVSAFE